jgi:acyl-CoA thioesterase YciA
MASEAVSTDKHACDQNDDAARFNMERAIAVRMTMQPQHTNGRGKIFGGRLLELMDLAGAYAAHRVCKQRFIPNMVTRVMNEVEFKQPVEVNDAVTFYSSVVKVGNTSVTVKVEVEADRAGQVIPVLSSTMVFVAVDNNNKTVSIRDFACGCEPTIDAGSTESASQEETSGDTAEKREGNDESTPKHEKKKKNKKKKCKCSKKCKCGKKCKCTKKSKCSKKCKCSKKHKRDKSDQ